MTLMLADIAKLAGNRLGVYDLACPMCGPDCKAASNRKRRVLRVWWEEASFARYRCARCEMQGFARPDAASPPPLPAPQRHAKPPVDDAARTELALSIWEHARPIGGTPVETYLRSRGIAYDGDTLRWHGNCPFGRDHVGAMIALVRNIATDKPQAIHRTAIDRDGRKLAQLGANGRLTLGPIGGGAVKLTCDENVTLAIAIGEGIESALSIRNLPNMGAMSVWALLAANQVAQFPVLGGIEALWVAVDNDATGTGQRAAETVAVRWGEAGREVYRVMPTRAGADLNDLVGMSA
jgi:putative DNA primase/helicase